MNRKFTSASSKDKNKVTLNLGQLDDGIDTDGVPRSLLTTGSILIVSVEVKYKVIEVMFKVNRLGKSPIGAFGLTAATLSWPRELRLPKVGKPVTYNVVGVNYV